MALSENHVPLDLLGILEGTDKSSLAADYLDTYDDLFGHLRDQQFDLLEIGVFNGGSLRTWKHYFPHALITGIDIRSHCKTHEEDRVAVHIGSQDDPGFLYGVLQHCDPLIVIDDGSHLAHLTISSFEQIFPRVLPGGYYIVEDAYMHYGREEKIHAGFTTIPLKQYFADIAESITGKILKPSVNYGIRGYILNNASWIAFMRGAIIIRKKPKASDNRKLVEYAEQVANEYQHPRYWFGAAGVVLSKGGEAHRAEALARRAVELDDGNGDYHQRLGEALELQNRTGEAYDSYRRAVERSPRLLHAWDRAGNIKLRDGDLHAAVECFRGAVDSHPNLPQSRRSLAQAYERLGDMPSAIEWAERAAQLAVGGRQEEEMKSYLDKLRSK